MTQFKVYFRYGWRWLLFANNGEPVAQSEPYSSKQAAIQGAQAVKSIAPSAAITVQQ